MTYQPVTPETVAKAKADALAEREQNGIEVKDGTIVVRPRPRLSVYRQIQKESDR